ncbi:general secretion pathway protein GspK [Bradyrhizobium cenepequi]|uniref:general secretion pathway protein GspK n=1 Tax=Bradyrhizobium cenepequi TaxID=2821403 RepID=UPI001CE24E27|nr:type II secretion system protein GspK [Bradyrhizobium cenepequi]MCA6110012.1 general secretion pathway protein GspK [Bradyrhizobium cenepequi]
MAAIGACKSSGERGFVIVAVLWILAALASLAMVFAAYLSASTRAIAVNETALQTEALVSASLELTAYQLALADESAKPQRGAFHFRMDDASVQVAFTSEAARVDLNLAPNEMLAGLFASLGASKDAAIEYANRVVGWRTRPVPGNANEEEARYNSVGYSPRQAPFTHVNELALVVGLPAALVERALPFVTVFNGSPDVDPAIAAPEVIEAMPDKSANKQDPFGGGSASVNAARPASQPSDSAKTDASTAKSPCYRVETTIHFRNGRRTTSEVVIAMGDEVEPYRVLSWQDDIAPRNAVSRRGST